MTTKTTTRKRGTEAGGQTDGRTKAFHKRTLLENIVVMVFERGGLVIHNILLKLSNQTLTVVRNVWQTIFLLTVKIGLKIRRGSSFI
jgi:hypothetical protein